MKYPIAKIFRTIQGEGHLAGTPMIFVRLAGCSLGCKQCDTDHKATSSMSAREVFNACGLLSKTRYDWIWITGGEPTDHDLGLLLSELRSFFLVAVATNGVRPFYTQVDWLSVSPHTHEIAQNRADEIKIVPGLNGLTLHAAKAFENIAQHKFVQPLWNDEESLKDCISFVDTHPTWRLSLQMHKYTGLDPENKGN